MVSLRRKAAISTEARKRLSYIGRPSHFNQSRYSPVRDRRKITKLAQHSKWIGKSIFSARNEIVNLIQILIEIMISTNFPIVFFLIGTLNAMILEKYLQK